MSLHECMWPLPVCMRVRVCVCVSECSYVCMGVQVYMCSTCVCVRCVRHVWVGVQKIKYLENCLFILFLLLMMGEKRKSLVK